jgi:hypothetical protein
MPVLLLARPCQAFFLVNNDMPIRQAIDELSMAAHCLSADECKNVVTYFPL